MSMRRCLHSLYRILLRVLAPGLRYSQAAYEGVLFDQVKPDTRWLDLGCGHQILPEWREKQELELAQRASLLVGLDCDLPALQRHPSIRHRARGDISSLPFAGESFDLVTSNMVFEHLEDPEVPLKEIWRALRHDGILIFHTPNTWGYSTMFARMIPAFLKDRLILFLQGRKAEDVFSTYYRINSPHKVKVLARRSGFEVAELMLIPSSGQLVMLPPLLVLELLWIRLTMTPTFKCLRTNMIVALRKRDSN